MNAARAMNAFLLLVLGLCSLAVTGAAYGAVGYSPDPLTPEDQESISVIRREPAQAKVLAEADAAFNQGRWESAASGYAALSAEIERSGASRGAAAVEAKPAADGGSELEATPDDDSTEMARRYPLRRRCQALTELGRRAEALEACEKLLHNVIPNAADLQAKIDALMLGTGRADDGELQQAAVMLRRVEGMDPESVWAESARCAIAARVGDRSVLAACSSALVKLAPNGRLTQRFAPEARESFVARWLKVGLLGALLLAALLTLAHRLLGARRGAVVASACVLLLAGARPALAEDAEAAPASESSELMSSEPPSELPAFEELGAEGGVEGFSDEMAQVQALVDKIAAAELLITEKNDWLGAVAAYNEIVRTVPYMVKAWRRLCEGYSYLNMPVEGAHCCRQAIQSPETNAWDRAMLVHHLLTGPEREKPELQAEAKQLVADNIAKWPTERWGYDAQCELALVQNDLPALVACSKHLDKLAPDDRKTVALLFSAALGEQRFSDADKIIERARVAGMDETTLDTMHATLARREPFSRRLLRSAPLGLALGAAVMALVLLVRYVLGLRKRRSVAQLGDVRA